MRTLYLRIFVAFWIAMVLALSCSVLITLWLADERLQHEQLRQDQLAREASGELSAGGVSGLRDWLARASTQVAPDRLFVLDAHGDDLLGRRVPEFLRARLGRGPGLGRMQDLPPDARDVRWPSQLISPNGEETYALSLLRLRRGPLNRLRSIQAPIVTTAATLLVSAIVCFLLARHLSDPIRHLRAATRSIAAGDLSVRVANLMGTRRDELALLAVDFDRMAERLRALLASHQELLRDVSHELRSPLARLQIALGLARRPGADLEREFDRIERETARLDELIGEILSLSRLDDPVRVLSTEAVNLEELLETLVENARVEAEPRAIEVRLARAPPLEIPADRELLYRAVENVLRNAVRFSPDGAVIELQLEQTGAGAQARALIRIRDHGPGIPAASLQRIFEPFYSVAQARERESSGYGIGLAITARVVALHGGSVQARNAEDGGLVVELRLPLAAQASA